MCIRDRCWLALKGEVTLPVAGCHAPEQIHTAELDAAPLKRAADGRGAKEAGGIPAVVCLPTIPMQLLRYVPFMTMLSQDPLKQKLLIANFVDRIRMHQWMLRMVSAVHSLENISMLLAAIQSSASIR